MHIIVHKFENNRSIHFKNCICDFLTPKIANLSPYEAQISKIIITCIKNGHHLVNHCWCSYWMMLNLQAYLLHILEKSIWIPNEDWHEQTRTLWFWNFNFEKIEPNIKPPRKSQQKGVYQSSPLLFQSHLNHLYLGVDEQPNFSFKKKARRSPSKAFFGAFFVLY